MPAENTPTGPVARDPLLGHEVPVYLGGEGPVEAPEGDRGDSFTPSSEPEAPVPQGTVASVVAEQTEPATEPANEERLRRPDGTFMSKAEIEAAKAAETQDEETQSVEAKDEDDVPRIPKARLDKEIKKRRAVEKQLAEVLGQKQAEQQAEQHVYDFDAAEEEYMNLLLDGKLAEAKAKRAEIRAAERVEFTSVAEKKAAEVDERSEALDAIGKIATRFEEQYPVLDAEGESFDATLVAEAEAIYLGYLNKGIYATAPEAFEAALEAVVKINGLQPVAPAPPKPSPGRTAQKRVEAIQGQPPLTHQAGQSSATAGAAVVPNIADLTEDQLSKLPLATLKRLRGDEL